MRREIFNGQPNHLLLLLTLIGFYAAVIVWFRLSCISCIFFFLLFVLLVLTVFFLLFYGSQFSGFVPSDNREINMMMMMMMMHRWYRASISIGPTAELGLLPSLMTSCAGGRHNMPTPCKLTF